MLVGYQGFISANSTSFAVSSTQAFLVGESKTLHDAPAYKVGALVRSLFDNAVSGVGQIISTVTRCFKVIDSYAPKLAVASAQGILLPKDVPNKELTREEKIFLRDLEVHLKLTSNAKNDRRYLREVKKHIDAYMVKNKMQAFPEHMMHAITLLTTYLDGMQFNDLWRDVPVFNDETPLSENCFYHQLDSAVQSVLFTQTYKDKMLAIRAVRQLVDIYLAPQNGMFKPHELDKFTMITKPIGCMLSIPELVETD